MTCQRHVRAGQTDERGARRTESLTLRQQKSPMSVIGLQLVDKKLFSSRRGRIALSANERVAEFLDFAIQDKFVYVNKLLEIMRH